MKKITVTLTIVFILLIFNLSCQKNNYYAQVEIKNIGDVIIHACVENDCLELAPDEAGVFEIYWKDTPALQVDLYSEIKDGQEWEEKTVILEDDDYLFWETGWDIVANKKVKSK
jgi:hypothetical protein